MCQKKYEISFAFNICLFIALSYNYLFLRCKLLFNQISLDMNKILQDLSYLIRSTINDEMVAKVFSSSAELKSELERELKNLQLELEQKIYSLNDGNLYIATTVNYIMRELILLSKELDRNAVPDDVSTVVINCLIDFLYTEFHTHLNPHTILPERYLLSKLDTCKNLIETCKYQLRQIAPASAIAKIIEDYLSLNGYIIRTLSELQYYVGFIRKLQEIIATDSTEFLETRLMEELYHINFNAYAFISYCSGVFNTQMQLESSKRNAQDLNFERLTTIAKMPQHKTLSFDASDKSLKIVINELLVTKMEYDADAIKRAQRRFLKFDKSPLVKANMSSRVLVIILNAAKTTQSLLCENFNDMYVWISANLGTKTSSGHLSIRSLKNRKNDAGAEHAREAVRHLNAMIDSICKDFNLNQYSDSRGK